MEATESADNVPDEHALYENTVTVATVHAPLERCFGVGADLELYPEWVAEILSVEVMERDDQNRPLTAKFQAEGMGRSSNYVLRYDYSNAPNLLAWSQVEGDLTRRIFGSYEFASVNEGSGGEVDATEVTYSLFIELAFPLPGFVKRRAEHKIVESALAGLKERAESSK